jgi:PEGA domain-containing protein
MKLGYGLTSDRFTETAAAHDPLASRWAPGLLDELGDRLLIFDNDGSPSLELLRFRKALTATPGFEVALRRRVERLSQLHHPAFATVEGVEYVEGHGLVLVSRHTPGRRLSELLRGARDPAFAADLIRQLTPALATLHEHGEGIGHGALSPTRIIITSEGRPIIVEHLLGAALERLHLTASRLYADFGIAVPPTDDWSRPRIDAVTDYFQLGLIALSVLLGRRLSSDEYPDNLSRVLDQVAVVSERRSPVPFQGLRTWLERALQLNGQFLDSGDAQNALAELPDAPADLSEQRWHGLLTLSGPADDRFEIATSSDQVTHSLRVVRPAIPDIGLSSDQSTAPPPSEPIETTPLMSTSDEAPEPVQVALDQLDAIDTNPGDRVEIEPARLLEGDGPGSDASAVAEESATREATAGTDWLITHSSGYVRALIIALASCAIIEGVVIADLLQRRWRAAAGPLAEVNVETQDPGASVLVDGQAAGVTPLKLAIGANTRSISVISPFHQQARSETAVGITGQETEEPPVKPAARSGSSSAAPSPAPQRSGGIRIHSPIEVEVFEGDRRLGSSATGVISASAGSHDVELVNSVLGFRSRQTVSVKGGQVAPLTVSPPNGRLNINAVPWAEVLIDGKSVGETPIGNLSLPLGEHEIVFRHPQLGEQKRTVVVRADSVARVSASFQH